MKFKVKSKDYYLYVKAKMSFGEKIDEKELDRFARLGLRGFMKPKMIKKNSAEYVGPIGQSLYERLKTPMSKREFLFVIEHIVVAMQKAQLNNLLLKGFVLDIQNVYINKITKEVQFIFLPLLNDDKETDVIEFVKTVIYSIRPEDDTASECISKFAYFINSLKTFDSEKVESFIIKEDRSIVNTIKKHNAGQSGFMTNDYGHYHEQYNQKTNDNDDEKTSLLVEEDEKTGLLIEEEATSLLVEEEEEETALLVDDEAEEDDEARGLLIENEATGLLIENEAELPKPHFASLERMLTEEKISINKAVFRLGKEKSYVDYFVSNNNAVSRSHADIIQRGKNYFIKDLNSKNFTYVNGQKIPVQVEIQIYDGDKIKLANEEFVFYE